MTSYREYPDVEQGTPEWADLRRGMVTASTVGQLITPKTVKPANNDISRGLTTSLTAERITGHTEPTYVSDDMWRGIEDEPVVRALYAEHYTPVREVGFMVRYLGSWASTAKIGYSPDGVVGEDGLIEIKSRRQKKHLATILADEVPPENMAQLQCGLLVSDRGWIDYVSYCSGMPLWVKRVEPDERWFDAITDAVEAFEQTAAEMVRTYTAATEGLHATVRVAKEMSL